MEGSLTKKEIIILALRITALYVFTLALAQLNPFLTSIASFFTLSDSFDSYPKVFLILGILSPLPYLLAAGGLWRFAPELADRILPGSLEHLIETNGANLSDAEAFCISLLGLFILASAIPALSQIVFATLWPHLDATYAKAITNPYSGEKQSLIPWSNIVYMCVRLAIGLWFTLGSVGILNLIKKVRYLGRSA
jgi:hypothetical protein